MKRIACLLMLLSSTLLLAPAAAQVPSPQTQALSAATFDQRLGSQAPLATRFVNESGEVVDLRRLLKDRPAVLALVYYRCPMLCNLVLDGLVRCLKQVTLKPGADFEVIIISIDPAETPALATSRKAQLLRELGYDDTAPGLHLLTGTEQSVRSVAASVGFNYRYDEITQQFAHPTGLVVLTPAGQVSRYLFGVNYSPRDMRLSLVEASDGKIGSAVDQILLRCYQYDPASGKYGFAIITAVRTGSVLAVLLLAGGVSWFVYRERQQLRRTEPSAADEPRERGDR